MGCMSGIVDFRQLVVGVSNAGLGNPVEMGVVTVIPEPATLVLAAFGLYGVLAAQRRVMAS